MSILDKFKRRPSEVRQVDFSTKADKLLLVPLGDVHLGAMTCKVDRFQATLDWIASKNCRVIIMGDK